MDIHQENELDETLFTLMVKHVAKLLGENPEDTTRSCGWAIVRSQWTFQAHKTQITMQRCITLLIASASIVIIQSCKKDDSSPVPGPNSPATLDPISNYSNLVTGNYWIYDRYKVDADDNILETLSTDSIWVAGDTLVNGETYKIVHRTTAGNVGPVFSFSLWRDSLNYLVDRTYPDVLFCTGPLDQVIHTRINEAEITWEYTVVSAPVQINVPAGTFTTYLLDQPISDFGPHPEQPAWKRFRSYWTPGVGRVRYYIFFADPPWGYRYDLVRYNVS